MKWIPRLFIASNSPKIIAKVQHFAMDLNKKNMQKRGGGIKSLSLD